MLMFDKQTNRHRGKYLTFYLKHAAKENVPMIPLTQALLSPRIRFSVSKCQRIYQEIQNISIQNIEG